MSNERLIRGRFGKPSCRHWGIQQDPPTIVQRKTHVPGVHSQFRARPGQPMGQATRGQSRWPSRKDRLLEACELPPKRSPTPDNSPNAVSGGPGQGHTSATTSPLPSWPPRRWKGPPGQTLTAVTSTGSLETGQKYDAGPSTPLPELVEIPRGGAHRGTGVGSSSGRVLRRPGPRGPAHHSAATSTGRSPGFYTTRSRPGIGSGAQERLSVTTVQS
jgi:hypothetical protein